MPSKKLDATQAAKQKEALSKFHEDRKKGLAPTSAGSIKEPRALNNVRRKIGDLTDPSSEIIRKAVTGGLVKKVEVWVNSDEQKAILNTDPSASKELMELDNGKEIEVLSTYIPVTKDKIEIAKWIIAQDIALKKAAEESKLRKLEAAMKQKRAEDEGAVPREDPVERAKQLASEGNHVRPVFSMDMDEDDDD